MNPVIKKAAHLPFVYNEAEQTNSLRWTLLYKEEDGTFEDQTGVFKCKDYFNDFVAKYNGFDVAPYGMDTRKIKLNEEGVYVLLTGVTFGKEFSGNMEVVTKEAQKQGFPPLSWDKCKKDWLLFIPREYMKSTYTISFLTGLIRLSHTTKCYDSIEEIVNSSVYDKPFKQHTDRALVQGFKPPLDKWIHLGSIYDNLLQKQPHRAYLDFASIIHNAGVYNWFNLLPLGKQK